MLAAACDNRPMAKDFDIEVLRKNLASIMARRNRKPTTLSLAVGKSPTLVRDLLEKTADTKLSTIYRLADELGVEISDLLRSDFQPIPAGPELFVKGQVQAGNWVEAYEWPAEEWQTLAGRPDISVPNQFRFFLRVAGDSMDEVYPEGTFVECLSIFAEPEITPGKRVIAVRARADGLIEATVKEVRMVDGKVWLAPRSRNPQHQAFAVDDVGDGIEEVRIVAPVVSSVRPE